MISGMREPAERTKSGRVEPHEEPTMTNGQPRTLGRGRMRRLAILGGPSTRLFAGRRAIPLYGVLHIATPWRPAAFG
jgi:hypothetical protein